MSRIFFNHELYGSYHKKYAGVGVKLDISRVIPRCYLQFFWYWYFAGIRFAGFSVFRGIVPPFLYTSPLSFPPFFQKGTELLKKGAIAPLLRKKGATAPFLIPKCTDRVFRRYGIGNTGEIPTEYRPKIPNWYTTLEISVRGIVF